MASGLIEHGQRRGEVREGPVERVALSHYLRAAPGADRQSLDDTVAFLLRGYAP